jgi:translation initiation factor 1A
MSQKNKKRGKNSKSKNKNDEVRELIFAEDDQCYGCALAMLGNGRLTARCHDGKERLCHISGRIKKNKRNSLITVGSAILVNLRSYEDDKADIVYVYQPDEVRRLIILGEIPDNFTNLEEDNNTTKSHDTINWENDKDDKDDIFGDETDDIGNL